MQGSRRRLLLAVLSFLSCGVATVFVFREPLSDAPARGDICHTHHRADYQGDMAVVWGSKFIVGNAGDCCAACAAAVLFGAPSFSRLILPFWGALALRPGARAHVL